MDQFLNQYIERTDGTQLMERSNGIGRLHVLTNACMDLMHGLNAQLIRAWLPIELILALSWNDVSRGVRSMT